MSRTPVFCPKCGCNSSAIVTRARRRICSHRNRLALQPVLVRRFLWRRWRKEADRRSSTPLLPSAGRRPQVSVRGLADQAA